MVHIDGSAPVSTVLLDIGTGKCNRTFALHVQDPAGICCCIFADSTSAEIHRTGTSYTDSTAGFRTVITDGTAIQIYFTALAILIIQQNCSALFISIISGDFTAIQIQNTLRIIQGNGTASAVFSVHFSASELSTKNIQCTIINIDTSAAPYICICALNHSTAVRVAVAKHETSIFHCNLIFSVAGIRFAIETQIQCIPVHIKIRVYRSIIRQIYIRFPICIGNSICTVPRSKCYIAVACVIARLCISTADTMHMLRRYHRPERLLALRCLQSRCIP